MSVSVSSYQPVPFLINTCSSSLTYITYYTSYITYSLLEGQACSSLKITNRSVPYTRITAVSVDLNVINFLVHFGILSILIFFHLSFITDTAVYHCHDRSQSHYPSFLRSMIRGLKRICLHLPLGL